MFADGRWYSLRIIGLGESDVGHRLMGRYQGRIISTDKNDQAGRAASAKQPDQVGVDDIRHQRTGHENPTPAHFNFGSSVAWTIGVHNSKSGFVKRSLAQLQLFRVKA